MSVFGITFVESLGFEVRDRWDNNGAPDTCTIRCKISETKELIEGEERTFRCENNNAFSSGPQGWELGSNVIIRLIYDPCIDHPSL